MVYVGSESLVAGRTIPAEDQIMAWLEKKGRRFLLVFSAGESVGAFPVHAMIAAFISFLRYGFIISSRMSNVTLDHPSPVPSFLSLLSCPDDN